MDDGCKRTSPGRESQRIARVQDSEVYQVAFEAAMAIFRLSRSFPPEEKYSLTDQIRRASRSVCTNIAEGWRKRRYRAVFLNKLSDAGQESAEVQTWLAFSLACGYITQAIFDDLNERYEHVYAMLTNMERKVDGFCRGA